MKACPSSDHCKVDWEGPFVATGTTKDVKTDTSPIFIKGQSQALLAILASRKRKDGERDEDPVTWCHGVT
jgi:hypothetical protein